MKKNKPFRSCLLIVLGLLAVAAMFFVGYRFLAFRVLTNTPPPQVLIQTPINQLEVSSTQMVPIHATAKSQAGIERLELWIDGEFIYAQDAPQGSPVTPLLLHTNWVPRGAGKHMVVVRAFAANQTQGQASVLIEALEELPAIENMVTYDPTGIIKAGEEVNPQDTDVSDTAEEDTGSNAGSSDAGGSETAPPVEPPAEDEPPGEGAAERAPTDPGAPPAEDEAPPPDIPETLDLLFFGFLFEWIGGDSDEDTNQPEDGVPLFLTIEALALQTDQPYEGVHCYVGLGDHTPLWYPDTDSDQSTDENFASIGGNQWNVADYLAEENGVVTSWVGGESLPFSINCIATAAGGTDSVDLGQLDLDIPPTEWDGLTRQASAADEGSFTLDYRVTIQEAELLAETDILPAPTNVHIDERRQELQWEFDKSGYTGPVHGFLIFVNDNLVLTANGAYERSIRIPPAWFNPPCGVEYEFRVRTYVMPYPEGDYSVPSAPTYLPDREDAPRTGTDCIPKFLLTFDTLITQDLGGDNIPNNWSNMVQNTSGIFYINEHFTEFSGVDLLPNHNYSLQDLTWSTMSQNARIPFEVQEGDFLRVGFDIYDWDDDSSSLLCQNIVFHDYDYNRLMSYGYFDDWLVSGEDGGSRCQVHYTIQPLGDTVLGTDNPNFLPLPWLDVTDIYRNPDTGYVELLVQNTGNAAYVYDSLLITLINRHTENNLHTTSHPITFEVGETKVFPTELEIDNLGDVCAIIDPNNNVTELYESTGALQHTSMLYCLPLPDLRIDELQFDPDENKLKVLVRNHGSRSGNLGQDATFDIYNLNIRIEPEGETIFIYSNPHEFGHHLMDQIDSYWIEWSLTEGERQRMQNGYTVTLDPENHVTEVDEDNNSMSVVGGKTLRVTWDGMYLHWYPSWYQDCTNDGAYSLTKREEVWVDIYLRSPETNDHVGNWYWENRIGDTRAFNENWGWDNQAHQVDFYISGEQDLIVNIRGEQNNDSTGSASAIFEASRDWDIMQSITPGGICDEEDNEDWGYSITAYPPDSSWSWCGGWSVYVNICEIYNP